MTVLVTGATGSVGTHVVRALAERGVPTRALGPHAALAEGDLGDRDALARALQGADRLFLACGNVPDQVALECRAIDAARAAGLARVVKLSGPGMDPSLLFERRHGEIEEHLQRSGLPSVLLRPSAYMSNLLASASTVAQAGTLVAPAGEARIAFVDPLDVGAAAAGALTTDEHEGAAYRLTGPAAIGYEQIAAALSTITGRAVRYVDVPDAAAREAMLDTGMPEDMADFILGTFRGQRAGRMADVTDGVRILAGREPRPFSAFARDHAAAFGSVPAPAPDRMTAGAPS